MKTLSCGRIFAAILLIFALALGFTPTAKATSLGEGGLVVAGDANGAGTGTQIGATVTSSFSMPGISGDVLSQLHDFGAYREAWYLISVDVSSVGSITRFTIGGWGPFTTDVYDRTDVGGGTQRSTNVDRTAGVVGFNTGPVTADKINPGEDGAWFIIRTNATLDRFGLVSSSVIDGGIDDALVIGIAEVPETMTLLLTGGGLLGLAFMRRRKVVITTG